MSSRHPVVAVNLSQSVWSQDKNRWAGKWVYVCCCTFWVSVYFVCHKKHLSVLQRCHPVENMQLAHSMGRYVRTHSQEMKWRLPMDSWGHSTRRQPMVIFLITYYILISLMLTSVLESDTLIYQKIQLKFIQFVIIRH